MAPRLAFVLVYSLRIVQVVVSSIIRNNANNASASMINANANATCHKSFASHRFAAMYSCNYAVLEPIELQSRT
jgi:hypothetical protein